MAQLDPEEEQIDIVQMGRSTQFIDYFVFLLKIRLDIFLVELKEDYLKL